MISSLRVKFRKPGRENETFLKYLEKSSSEFISFSSFSPISTGDVWLIAASLNKSLHWKSTPSISDLVILGVIG